MPQHVLVDETLAYTFETGGYPICLNVDIINMFDAHYAYRIASGFVGSSYAAPRSVSSRWRCRWRASPPPEREMKAIGRAPAPPHT